MNDILNQVREELGKRKGNLRFLSQAAGVGYMTTWRIANIEGYQPSYSSVMKLAVYLKIDPCNAA